MIDGPFIQLVSGEYVNPLDPWSFTPKIEDIAHALSNMCRFTGHTRSFLSVAQHSWLVSELVPREHRLAALLHDASEAYLCDLSRPIKHDTSLWRYREAEQALQARIYWHFGIPHEPKEVKDADLVALATEKRDLMPPGLEWLLLANVAPDQNRVEPWSPEWARTQFLARYNLLEPVGLRAAA